MSKTVLVMDDSEIVVATLDAVLRERGYQVLTALNLKQLEDHCAKARIDLVVLDVQMPEAFGDDVGQVLRDVRKVKAPILLFSGLPEPKLKERTEEAELDGYVCKSEGVTALVGRVASFLDA